MPGNPDRRAMWEALELARKGRGFVSPNPMVGCVLTRQGQVVGRGYHKAFGEPHAEIEALNDAREKAWGATMYVTLEPCCHETPEKKTPPCVPALLKARVDHVVVAMLDPNPLVSGKGVEALRQAGVKVDVGFMEQDARELNAAYISLLTRRCPLVTAKWAMTADGKIATISGKSRWISGEASRARTHQERAFADAVMIGINTALRDDPLLTARDAAALPDTPPPRVPTRIVVDPELRLPSDSRLAQSAGEAPLLVYTSQGVDSDRRGALESRGALIVPCEYTPRGHLSWERMLSDLGKRGCSSLLIEGGGGLLGSAFEARAVDRVLIFVAPLIIGGKDAVSAVGGCGVDELAAGAVIENLKSQALGQDILLEGRVRYPDRR